MATTLTLPGLVSVDPIQGLIDYVQDIKPYHTKIFETLVEYVYTDYVNVRIVDNNNLAINVASTDDVNTTIIENNGSVVTVPASITEAFDFFAIAPASLPPATIVRADAVNGIIYFAVGSPSINLASAVTYAVIAYTSITNTVTATALTGNLGLTPGSVITNFPPGTVSGTQNINNPVAITAKADAQAAYTFGQGVVPSIVIPTQLGGTSPAPGIYHSAAGTFQITGTVTLNGSATDIWIFQMTTTLTTAASSNVLLTGGAQAKNVYWLVGLNATLGVTSTFNGTLIAQVSINVNTNAVVTGHLFALTGTVAFDHNTVIATPAGSSPSSPTISIQAGDILNITGSPNAGNYDVLSVVYDSVDNEIAVTLNTLPSSTPGAVATFFHTDTTYAFHLAIESVQNPGPTIIDPATAGTIGQISFTTPIFIVSGNATRAIQAGSIFRVQNSTTTANNSSQEKTYPITHIYYAVYVNFIPGINPNGQRNPALDTTIIGVGIPTGSPITAPFILPTSQGAVGFIIPYNITGYDDRYDAPFNRMAGYNIISG